MRLFVADLDGTLLSPGAILSCATRIRLNALIERGLFFTIATARAFPAIKVLLEGLRLQLPVIEQNGALLRDFASGRLIRHFPMAATLVEGVLEIFRDQGLDPFVSALAGAENPLFFRRLDNPDMLWYLDEKLRMGDPRPAKVRDFRRARSLSVLSFTYLGDRERTSALESALRSRCEGVSITVYDNAYTRGSEINITAPNADKGRAVAFLRQQAPSSVEVIAFGDNNNDLAMFRAADITVAMPHATAELKALATYVAQGDVESAVLTFIEDCETFA